MAQNFKEFCRLERTNIDYHWKTTFISQFIGNCENSSGSCLKPKQSLHEINILLVKDDLRVAKSESANSISIAIILGTERAKCFICNLRFEVSKNYQFYGIQITYAIIFFSNRAHFIYRVYYKNNTLYLMSNNFFREARNKILNVVESKKLHIVQWFSLNCSRLWSFNLNVRF